MTAQHIRIWWVVMPMTIGFAVGGQSEWPDRSPHKAGFITVNIVKLHYLDWGGKETRFCFCMGRATRRIGMTTSHPSSPTSFACSESPGAVTANPKFQRPATTLLH